MQKITGKSLCYLITCAMVVPLITSCSSNSSKNKAKKSYLKPRYTKAKTAFDLLINQFSYNIEEIWGHSEVLIAGPKDYIKYSNDLQTRTHINFEKGIITIETLSVPFANIFLQKAIVSTLLMGDDIRSSDLFSPNNINESTIPFLYKQVVDQAGQPIRWEWRANEFAKYLIDNKLIRRRSGNKIISYLTIKLIPNHMAERAQRFLPLVKKSAQKYGIDKSLILSIMHIESDFNPYAVSRTGAIGLMQVQQHTAGKDVFNMLGRSGQPSRDFLFEPKNNIDIGTAYIAMLRDQYLNGIRDPLSLYYAVVTAYNGGAGSVLRVFSQDRVQAVNIINKMTPQDVYKTLTTKHPFTESRKYLEKVSSIHKKYINY